MLTELDAIPAGLLNIEARDLHLALPGPTLIHLDGHHPDPLFISVLLHGNETVGWDAMRQLLTNYLPAGGEKPLPRALSLFIGNISAAAAEVRTLPHQPDYNRVWPGCGRNGQDTDTPEHAMMEQLVAIMAARKVFASIDLHNNTGINPHYACVNVIDPRFLHLAALFSRVVVYFTRPCGVQSNAMARLCPSVTLECGKSGQSLGVDHAREYLDAALHLTEHPSHAVAEHDIDIYHTVAVVKVPPDISFGFADDGSDINFEADLERLNFQELPAGTQLGRIRQTTIPLSVRDDHDKEIAPVYLKISDNALKTRKPLMPAMLTTDHNAIRLDCLCYFMERYTGLQGI
jgi:succinylglutamate desuccinylase